MCVCVLWVITYLCVCVLVSGVLGVGWGDLERKDSFSIQKIRECYVATV